MPAPQSQTLLTGLLGDLQKAMESLGNTIKNNLLAPVETFTKTFESMGEAIKKMLDPSASTHEVLGKVGEALKMFGKSIGVLGMAMAGPAAAVLVFGKVLGGFVEKANPAVFQQFTLAVNDLMAVIGRALVPIFETVVIPVLRLMGDALMDLGPAGAALAAALQPLVELIGGAFAVAVGLMAEGIKLVAPLIMAFGRVLQDVVRFVSHGVRELLALIGVTLPEFGGKPGAAVGAATRQAGHASIDEVVKQAQRASFSLGSAQNDPMGKMADATKDIKARADAIYEYIQKLPERMWDFIQKLPDLIGKFILDLPARLADAIYPKTRGPVTNQQFLDKYGVSRWDAMKEAARQFGRDVKNDTWVGRQVTKPGVFGFTSLNPL